MSSLQKELRKIRSLEQKQRRILQKIEKEIFKNAERLEKSAHMTLPTQRLLGVEVIRAKRKFFLWLGLLLGALMGVASYIWKNRANLLPGDIQLPW